MNEEENYYQVTANKIDGSIESKMFGKPCFKIGKKAFTCFFEKSMVFKLPAEVKEEALELADTKLFDPSGKNRPMKEWVQISYDHKDSWETFAVHAANYVIENS